MSEATQIQKLLDGEMRCSHKCKSVVNCFNAGYLWAFETGSNIFINGERYPLTPVLQMINGVAVVDWKKIPKTVANAYPQLKSIDGAACTHRHDNRKCLPSPLSRSYWAIGWKGDTAVINRKDEASNLERRLRTLEIIQQFDRNNTEVDQSRVEQLAKQAYSDRWQRAIHNPRVRVIWHDDPLDLPPVDELLVWNNVTNPRTTQRRHPLLWSPRWTKALFSVLTSMPNLGALHAAADVRCKLNGEVHACTSLPTTYKVAERGIGGRLHSLDGPALEYAGHKVYAISGFEVDERIITKKRLSASVVRDAWRIINAEYRRHLIMHLGYKHIIKVLNFKTIARDVDQHGNDRELLEPIVPAQRDRISNEETRMLTARYVHVVCPSTKSDYLLCVPPTATTPQDAVAWTFGQAASMWAPAHES